ncbi:MULTISPECIES: hypothetical protein [unclassified Novosphingobium]|uniref:hypothetical protein n=1 Tax=unclassified Novosphingobium TaxID=2644732 RepID=UPI00146D49E5|nr:MULTISPECIES: hypothetical protein [unclassified Novosphingobium]NMN03791.1 hypothetical protein [Novosphingobium sp. SG919]NMN86219.1 hypothetical protein [Novosphingobium sp. SG916]
MEWLNLVGTSLKLLIFQWRAEVAPRLHPIHLQRIVKPSAGSRDVVRFARYAACSRLPKLTFKVYVWKWDRGSNFRCGRDQVAGVVRLVDVVLTSFKA